MAGSEARLVILSGTKAAFTHVAVKPERLRIANDEESEEIKEFQDAIYAFLRENHVDKVAIKKRAKGGDRAGGAVSFKLECLVQLYPAAEVILVPPQTISAANRRYSPTAPTSIYGYQIDAFEAAFTALD